MEIDENSGESYASGRRDRQLRVEAAQYKHDWTYWMSRPEPDYHVFDYRCIVNEIQRRGLTVPGASRMLPSHE